MIGIGGRRCRSPYRAGGLNKSTFGEGHDLIAADNAVIDQAHIELTQHLFKPLCDELIGVRRLGYEAGMLGFIRECQHGLFIRC
jgi:hypothetical protein